MNGLSEAIRSFFQHLRPMRRQTRITGIDGFTEFLATRASFVAQKKLYEYVKQRMGISYPRHFQDDAFIASLNVAKWNVYAACLSDLSIWMASQLLLTGATREEAARVALLAHADVIRERFGDREFTGDSAQLLHDHDARIALIDLAAFADEAFDAFERSTRELVRWAPISDELKRYDVEIVRNSLRFAWLHIRDEYRASQEPEAVLAAWRKRLTQASIPG